VSDEFIKIPKEEFESIIYYLKSGIDDPTNRAKMVLAKGWLKTLSEYDVEASLKVEKELADRDRVDCFDMPTVTVNTNEEIASPIGRLKKGDKISYEGCSDDNHCYNFYFNGKKIENRSNLLNKTLYAIERFSKMKKLIRGS
jgi:hypothetical protein